MMMRLLWVLLLLCTPVWSDTPASLYDGELKFSLPDKFTTMSKEIFAAKFPGPNAPQHVYSDKNGTTSVAFSHSQSKLSDDKLEEFQAFMVSMLPKMKQGLRWVKKDIVKIAGRRWVRLEFTTPAVDCTIHNEILITPMQGRALLVNLNCVQDSLSRVQRQLDSIKNSLRVGR